MGKTRHGGAPTTSDSGIEPADEHLLFNCFNP
jgi:hypothetical protein